MTYNCLIFFDLMNSHILSISNPPREEPRMVPERGKQDEHVSDILILEKHTDYTLHCTNLLRDEYSLHSQE